MHLSPFQQAADRAARQHGLVTLRQMLHVGVPKSNVYRWVDAGRLIRIESGVFLLAGSPFTWHTRVMSVVLASGGVASHRTACVLYGVDDYQAGQPDITIPHGKRGPRSARVHRTCAWDLIGTRSINYIPVTSPERLLVDMAAIVTIDRLEYLADRLKNSVTSWPAIISGARQHARRGRSGTVALRDLLMARCGAAGADSPPEKRLKLLLVSAGYPEPVEQVPVHDEGGALITVADLGYPDRGVLLEYDGVAAHLTRAAMDADRRKRNRARAVGYEIIEVTATILDRHPVEILDALDAALARRPAGSFRISGA